ncbi:hypothetical protein ATCV1_z392L [Acanthocystis turfacea chlorella virus 1]|uniref:Uncharacterized protein z392L n=1 Tax=Chlorovirus heliozoae TaxID=322019 RepID=A7K902_9PHYC|nr:hypothetical protein ATCV1_z392L [Acanthocystis turfacea chlorella virus 1]ABT16526.1 hypothetical protein ATCV1_z392L [Acanthocystis turfacea chlorella virus 1]
MFTVSYAWEDPSEGPWEGGRWRTRYAESRQTRSKCRNPSVCRQEPICTPGCLLPDRWSWGRSSILVR